MTDLFLSVISELEKKYHANLAVIPDCEMLSKLIECENLGEYLSYCLRDVQPEPTYQAEWKHAGEFLTFLRPLSFANDYFKNTNIGETVNESSHKELIRFETNNRIAKPKFEERDPDEDPDFEVIHMHSL